MFKCISDNNFITGATRIAGEHRRNISYVRMRSIAWIYRSARITSPVALRNAIINIDTEFLVHEESGAQRKDSFFRLSCI